MILVTRRSVYKLLHKRSTVKNVRDDWKNYGRNRFLNDDDLNGLATKMAIKSGYTITEDKLEMLFKKNKA